MTEKEKMLKQKLYDANYDKDLLEERVKAKDLCYKFNQLLPSDEEGQQKLMKQLLGKIKDAFCIVAPFWCDYGYNIEIGENPAGLSGQLQKKIKRLVGTDDFWLGMKEKYRLMKS